ncbi:hypothetical protein CDIK_1907 [Cucumispora dikerogammari]|nr:hypothetical protein CDIK_1907 [Cucumispora dikerogammari]
MPRLNNKDMANTLPLSSNCSIKSTTHPFIAVKSPNHTYDIYNADLNLYLFRTHFKLKYVYLNYIIMTFETYIIFLNTDNIYNNIENIINNKNNKIYKNMSFIIKLQNNVNNTNNKYETQFILTKQALIFLQSCDYLPYNNNLSSNNNQEHNNNSSYNKNIVKNIKIKLLNNKLIINNDSLFNLMDMKMESHYISIKVLNIFNTKLLFINNNMLFDIKSEKLFNSRDLNIILKLGGYDNISETHSDHQFIDEKHVINMNKNVQAQTNTRARSSTLLSLENSTNKYRSQLSGRLPVSPSLLLPASVTNKRGKGTTALTECNKKLSGLVNRNETRKNNRQIEDVKTLNPSLLINENDIQDIKKIKYYCRFSKLTNRSLLKIYLSSSISNSNHNTDPNSIFNRNTDHNSDHNTIPNHNHNTTHNKNNIDEFITKKIITIFFKKPKQIFNLLVFLKKNRTLIFDIYNITNNNIDSITNNSINNTNLYCYNFYNSLFNLINDYLPNKNNNIKPKKKTPNIYTTHVSKYLKSYNKHKHINNIKHSYNNKHKHNNSYNEIFKNILTPRFINKYLNKFRKTITNNIITFKTPFLLSNYLSTIQHKHFINTLSNNIIIQEIINIFNTENIKLHNYEYEDESVFKLKKEEIYELTLGEAVGRSLFYFNSGVKQFKKFVIKNIETNNMAVLFNENNNIENNININKFLFKTTTTKYLAERLNKNKLYKYSSLYYNILTTKADMFSGIVYSYGLKGILHEVFNQFNELVVILEGEGYFSNVFLLSMSICLFEHKVINNINYNEHKSYYNTDILMKYAFKYANSTNYERRLSGIQSLSFLITRIKDPIRIEYIKNNILQECNNRGSFKKIINKEQNLLGNKISRKCYFTKGYNLTCVFALVICNLGFNNINFKCNNLLTNLLVNGINFFNNKDNNMNIRYLEYLNGNSVDFFIITDYYIYINNIFNNISSPNTNSNPLVNGRSVQFAYEEADKTDDANNIDSGNNINNGNKKRKKCSPEFQFYYTFLINSMSFNKSINETISEIEHFIEIMHKIKDVNLFYYISGLGLYLGVNYLMSLNCTDNFHNSNLHGEANKEEFSLHKTLLKLILKTERAINDMRNNNNIIIFSKKILAYLVLSLVLISKPPLDTNIIRIIRRRIKLCTQNPTTKSIIVSTITGIRRETSSIYEQTSGYGEISFYYNILGYYIRNMGISILYKKIDSLFIFGLLNTFNIIWEMKESQEENGYFNKFFIFLNEGLFNLFEDKKLILVNNKNQGGLIVKTKIKSEFGEFQVGRYGFCRFVVEKFIDSNLNYNGLGCKIITDILLDYFKNKESRKSTITNSKIITTLPIVNLSGGNISVDDSGIRRINGNSRNGLVDSSEANTLAIKNTPTSSSIIHKTSLQDLIQSSSDEELADFKAGLFENVFNRRV